MPIDFARNKDDTVVVAYCHGHLTRADVSASVRFAFDTQAMKPGLNRLVTVAEDAELNELDPETLVSIQRQILDKELQGGGDVRFRSVLVASTSMQKSIMRLYKAIWDVLEFPGVEFFVVESEQEAWDLLGIDPAELKAADG